jgi:hypothetical protein
MMLITLGFDSTIFIDAPNMIYKNTSAGSGVLRAAAFASSSTLVFLFLSMYSTVKSLKKFSFLSISCRYFSRVGSLAIHSFSI